MAKVVRDKAFARKQRRWRDKFEYICAQIGNWTQVAEEIGISESTVYGIRRGMEIGPTPGVRIKECWHRMQKANGSAAPEPKKSPLMEAVKEAIRIQEETGGIPEHVVKFYRSNQTLQELVDDHPFKEVELVKPTPNNPAPTTQEQELKHGVVVDFAYEKLTDGGGAYRFKEVDGDGNLKAVNDRIVGTLYLRRKLFSGQPPKAVTAVLQVKF
jgi:hypothetical protein